MKIGGGTAGHNGLRSTEAHIGNDFRRVRIGIGHPGHKDRVTGHVLGNYAKAEMDAARRHCSARSPPRREWLAEGDDARFMSDVALRLQDRTSPRTAATGRASRPAPADRFELRDHRWHDAMTPRQDGRCSCDRALRNRSPH